MDSLSARVRSHLAAYLANEQTLDEFEAWFVPNALGHAETEQTSEGLIYAIELHLAEFARGHRTESELRTLLATLASSADPISARR